MFLEVGEGLKSPIRRMQGLFPSYIAIAAVLRVIRSLGSSSFIGGFSRMQVLVCGIFMAGTSLDSSVRGSWMFQQLES